MKLFISTLIAFAFILSFHTNANAQESADEPQEKVERDDKTRINLEKDLRLEFEPGLFFNFGRSLTVMYTLTQDNNLHLGLYLMTTNIPEQISKNMLKNVTDSTTVRVTQEYALNLRYRIRLSKKLESNPFVGLIFGWENIRLSKWGVEDLNIQTFIATPHIGYEFYLYRQMFYINPQVRSVFYFGQKYSDGSRPEKLNNFTAIPSLTIGMRL